jgi:hypothetical protein
VARVTGTSASDISTPSLYSLNMDGEISVVGDEPLVEGLRMTLRMRRDFTVTDADRLLAAARTAYRELNPEASEDRAAGMVTSAADALYTLLERVGVLGDGVDDVLAEYAIDGLGIGGQVSEVTFDDPFPLPLGPCHFGVDHDVFALPDRRRAAS